MVAAAVPSSRENAKKPGPVEANVVEEAEQRLVIGFGLAREADDERRTERGVGLLGADAGDDLGEALAASPPLHAAQQSGRRVLQREVEVRARPTRSSSIVETSGSFTSDG